MGSTSLFVRKSRYMSKRSDNQTRLVYILSFLLNNHRHLINRLIHKIYSIDFSLFWNSIFKKWNKSDYVGYVFCSKHKPDDIYTNKYLRRLLFGIYIYIYEEIKLSVCLLVKRCFCRQNISKVCKNFMQKETSHDFERLWNCWSSVCWQVKRHYSKKMLTQAYENKWVEEVSILHFRIRKITLKLALAHTQ